MGEDQVVLGNKDQFVLGINGILGYDCPLPRPSATSTKYSPSLQPYHCSGLSQDMDASHELLNDWFECVSRTCSSVPDSESDADD